MTACECEKPPEGEWIFCQRHQCKKTAHWVDLCQARENYFQAWEEGHGPGQITTAEDGPKTATRTKREGGCGKKREALAYDAYVYTQEEVAYALTVCEKCQHYNPKTRKCEESECSHLAMASCEQRIKSPVGYCPLGMW